MRRIDRLARRVKNVLFFTHPASLTSSISDFNKSTSQDTGYISNSSQSFSHSDSNTIGDDYCEHDNVSNNSKLDNRVDSGEESDEYETIEYDDMNVPMIIKSTTECKQELISKINFSYESPEQVKSVYGLSPVDYRINSLKLALEQLNNLPVYDT
ncbi:uncharacterized protein TA20530 [Theileria annulata]|uniref:Uncharacterized protein n=1 Tax=Theileria annulata TaxID=5874 RepID=Q4UH51_THEAN|nr:uncharacterized protein TA20530 [Theileria annulata]CAI73588.1 hypothetical protein TA20530 [Theileria annulata]|eukprot:XP_954265.1 hypothetical protein TA20530 [Theileria annulata]